MNVALIKLVDLVKLYLIGSQATICDVLTFDESYLVVYLNDLERIVFNGPHLKHCQCCF